MQWFLLFFILSDVVNCNTRDLVVSEVDHLSRLVPLKTEAYVMFWRPQKVGSSTILSFLISYAFRYNLASKRRGFANSFCWKLMVCLSHSSYSTDKNLMKHHEINNAEVKLTQDFKERQSEKLIYSMSWSHQICNLPSYLVQSSLPCGFAKDFNYINSLGKNNSKSDERHISFSKPSFPLPNADNIKELFVVRDPLSRMISVYYFWGELFRLRMTMSAPIIPRMMNNIGKIIDNRINGKGPNIVRIGTKLDRVEVIKGHLFDYHGNESSAPDEHIAMRFASNLPLKPGMPGPSYSWSAISDNYKDAVNELKKDRIMTIITERLDESLVVTSNYMNWSLADVIVVKNRKALSTHPKHTQWPAKSIEIMKASLHKSGEYAIYDAANKKLQDRITVLEKQGISVKLQVKLLQEVRRRVSQICLDHANMIIYRTFIEGQGYNQHFSNNKLRDTEDWIVQNRHMFSYNGDIIHSYDVCANCEAHAILHGISKLSVDVKKVTKDNLSMIVGLNFPSVLNMSKLEKEENINFVNCPSVGNMLSHIAS